MNLVLGRFAIAWCDQGYMAYEVFENERCNGALRTPSRSCIYFRKIEVYAPNISTHEETRLRSTVIDSFPSPENSFIIKKNSISFKHFSTVSDSHLWTKKLFSVMFQKRYESLMKEDYAFLTIVNIVVVRHLQLLFWRPQSIRKGIYHQQSGTEKLWNHVYYVFWKGLPWLYPQQHFKNVSPLTNRLLLQSD